VAGITHNKTHDPEKAQRILAIAEKAQAIKDELLRAVDADTAAFNAYLEAVRLPKATPEEQRVREEKMQAGLKQAVAVPYQTALAAAEAMRVAHEMAIHGHAASVTDAAVGCAIAFAGVRGGVWNVLVNLKGIKDAAYVADMRSKCAAVLEEAQKLLRENERHVDKAL
jgi:glutamate formiminotransferase / formiminotetrahydrofolate cyclodeaminase